LQPIALQQTLRDKLALDQANGLMVTSVDPEASGGKSGLLIGDILLTWDRVELMRTETLRSLLSDAIGKTVELTVLRGGEIVKIQVPIAERKVSRP
jgi:S1-C subfamily serine protease